MPCRPTNGKSPVRAALLLAACVLAPAAVWAARPVPVFQVDVAGQTAPDLEQAMRAALVRATGRRESATDPVFGGLISDAPKYVQRYDRGPQGELQVVFNRRAVDQAIAALDRSVWDADRPFTLVVLYPAPDQADQATDQSALEQAAEQRGLPISIVPLPVADDSGNLLPRVTLLQMAQRYGAEQLLIGRPPPEQVTSAASAVGAGAPPSATNTAGPAAGTPPATAPVPSAGSSAASSTTAAGGAPGNWQWTLYTDFTSQSWSGPLTTGIDDTVALLAPPPGPASANAPAQTQLEIQGVSSLDDYARIELMLAAVPGVSAAQVSQVRGDSAVFDLTVRGGAAAIARALASSPSFSRVGGTGGTAGAPQGSAAPAAPLVFRYRSG